MILFSEYIQQHVKNSEIGETHWIVAASTGAGAKSVEKDFVKKGNVRVILLTQFFFQFTGTGETVTITDDVNNQTICTFTNTLATIGFFPVEHLIPNDHLKISTTSATLNWSVCYVPIYSSFRKK